jgi:hypothetical protein
MKNVKTFEDFSSNSTEKVDEAMVQVAGKSKPAGAMVLSKTILAFLKDGKYLSSAGEKEYIGLEDDIAKLIMDSTF